MRRRRPRPRLHRESFWIGFGIAWLLSVLAVMMLQGAGLLECWRAR
jgi:hypothetical protein